MIRAAREARGWSQGQLARATSLSRSTISRLEDGTRVPSDAVLAQLAHVLDLDPDDLAHAYNLIPPDLRDRLATDRAAVRACRAALDREDCSLVASAMRLPRAHFEPMADYVRRPMGGFVERLLDAYAHADPGNRAALALGFEWLPDLYTAWCKRHDDDNGDA